MLKPVTFSGIEIGIQIDFDNEPGFDFDKNKSTVFTIQKDTNHDIPKRPASGNLPEVSRRELGTLYG
jgi:hypothetical protein